MAYRKGPKWTPKEVPKFPKGKYQQEGFISNAEKSADRVARLVEAKASGYELSQDNLLYLQNHVNQQYAVVKTYCTKQLVLHEKIRIATERLSHPIIGGFS